MQKNRRSLKIMPLLAIIIFSILILNIPSTSAQSVNWTLISSQTTVSGNPETFFYLYGNATAGINILGQVFSGNDKYLREIDLYAKFHSPPAKHDYTIYMTVGEASGSSMPYSVGAMMATSQATATTTQDGWLNFTFSDSNWQLLTGHQYFFYVYTDAKIWYDYNSTPVGDTDQALYFDTNNGGTPAFAGSGYQNIIRVNTGAWQTLSGATYNLRYYVWGSATPYFEPEITPSPTPVMDYKWDENADQWYFWNGTHWVISNGPTPTANTQLTTFTNNAISILFPLALIFGLALLGAWKAGFYGFMAGMTIGAVLGVLYLDLEIWVIVLIAIVDIIGIFAVKGRDKE